MNLLFLGGGMHMKMLHGEPKYVLTTGRTIKGEHYVHAGQLKDGIHCMGLPADFYTPKFQAWTDEAKRLLSDPSLFKGPQAQNKRKRVAHKPEHSYTTEQVVALLKAEHKKIRNQAGLTKQS